MMATPTKPRMPADASDDLVLALYRETSRQTPVELRATCPVHLNWRDRCRHLHDGGERRG